MRVEEIYSQNRSESLLIYRSSGEVVEKRIGTTMDALQTDFGIRSTLFNLVDPVSWRARNAVWKNEVPSDGDPYRLSGIELLYRATRLQPDLNDLSEDRITDIGQRLFIVAEGLKALSRGNKERLMRIVEPPTTLPQAS